VDAYTRRVLLRHGIIGQNTSYEEIRAMIEQAIRNIEVVVQAAAADPRHPVSRISSSARSALAQHYNELHALIVRVGNHYCRTKPICEGCPLQPLLKTSVGATTQRAPESY
jgi:endonuclease-3 related protein